MIYYILISTICVSIRSASYDLASSQSVMESSETSISQLGSSVIFKYTIVGLINRNLLHARTRFPNQTNQLIYKVLTAQKAVSLWCFLDFFLFWGSVMMSKHLQKTDQAHFFHVPQTNHSSKPTEACCSCCQGSQSEKTILWLEDVTQNQKIWLISHTKLYQIGTFHRNLKVI